MKNVFLAIGLVAVLINSVLGLIFTAYPTFNWLSSDVVIIINVILLHLLFHSKMSDGFKIGLTIVFSLLGIIMFLLSIKLENRLSNNMLFAGLLVLFSIQIILLIIIKSLKSEKNDNSSMS